MLAFYRENVDDNSEMNHHLMVYFHGNTVSTIAKLTSRFWKEPHRTTCILTVEFPWFSLNHISHLPIVEKRVAWYWFSLEPLISLSDSRDTSCAIRFFSEPVPQLCDSWDGVTANQTDIDIPPCQASNLMWKKLKLSQVSFCTSLLILIKYALWMHLQTFYRKFILGLTPY